MNRGLATLLCILALLLPACGSPTGSPGGGSQGETEEGPDDRLPGLYVGAETTPVSGVSGLAASLSWIAANITEGGQYTIILDGNETVPAQELHYTRTVSIGIKGYGGTPPEIQLSGTGSLLSLRGVKQGTRERKVTVTLENIRLLGVSDNNAALVTLGALSALELKTGSEISGNTNYLREVGIITARGGGVYMAPGDFSAELLINGGKISGNTVYVKNLGSDGFHFMWYTYAYGGGVYMTGSEAVITMNSGEISGNTLRGLASAGWPATVSGGGIYALSGRVTIAGGTISGNLVEATGFSGGYGGAGDRASGAGVDAASLTKIGRAHV
jgi:hypothetical protein